MNDAEPSPLPREAIERAIAAIDSGTTYKAALEALLLELDDDAADQLMQLQREARGTWLLALRVPSAGQRGARALFVGNALSGAHTPLAHHGFDVTLLDRSALRLRFARQRNTALVPGGTTHGVCSDGTPRLPFADATFDLVVQEDGLPTRARGWGHDLAELRRVCRGELLFVADNRLAYKRSTGRRGVFDVPSPLRYAAGVARTHCEHTLAGYRELTRAPDFSEPRAFALYPHAREFTFVVGLDGAPPALELGPKERANRAKLLAHSLGLFPLFAPSFALLSSRRTCSAQQVRYERLLDALAGTTGEPRPELEHLVATRGNSALLLTRAAGGRPGGDWCVHVGLSAAQRSQLERHAHFLRQLALSFAGCPVPQFLFEGVIDGLFVTCERRARGLTAPQLTGELDATRRTLAELSEILARLTVTERRALDEPEFERLIGRRFDVVARHAGDADTQRALARMRARAREDWLGLEFPLVVQHADLRSKHVQVELDGRVSALLDWGSAEERDLPYFDLVHYLLHERKQADGLDARGMWALLDAPAHLRDWERAALDAYCARLGLDLRYRRALHALYPVVVAAMAETHWDYSRPRWLRRQFGIGEQEGDRPEMGNS